jgi:DNA polymerase
MPNIVHLDYETYSACDIKTCGGHRYARDPSTEILMIGLALNDGPAFVWVPPQYREKFESHESGLALAILGLLADPDTLVYAHNATGFEIPITDALFERTTGFKPPAHRQWRCTAAMARTAAMPSALDKLAEDLGMAQQKDHRGKALIRKFSIPQKATATQIKKGLAVAARILPQDDPAAFAEFVEYCRQDVRVERDVAKVLKDFELRGDSLATFQLDIEINCRGLPVNLAGIAAAQKIVDAETLRIADEFRTITGFEHTQGAKFLSWLKERGYTGENLTADVIEEALEEGDETLLGGLPEDAQMALKLKQQIGYASIKKLAAMAKLAGPDDNRVRGTLLYHSATTGRWAGRNVQPQNFKRPTIPDSEDAYRDIRNGMPAWQVKACYGPPLEVISSCVRHFIHDTNDGPEWYHIDVVEDRPMLDADYAAIEGRIVCWLAGQEDALDEYRAKLDRYKVMASVIYGIPVADVSKDQRFVGKEAVLGCGFQMGAPKFQARVLERAGVQLTRKAAIAVVKAFRSKHDKVRDLWRFVELAAMQAIRSPGTMFQAGPHVKFFTTKTMGVMCLFARLPSGRRLCYPRPAVVMKSRVLKDPLTDEPMLDEDGRQIIKTSEGVTFHGQLPLSVHYGRVDTYGGSLVENLTQAVAADIMANGAINCERAGYKIAALIHDEALAYMEPHQTAKEFVKLLTTLPRWADGLPIEAEGGVVPFYRK